MTCEQLVKYLRFSVSIQDPTGTEQDSSYLSMTDDEIKLLMEVVLTRNFPEVPSLDYLPTEYVYPVILLSKIELYHTLAVKEAPLFDIGADNNNYLKRSQRFSHYYNLIQQTEAEYSEYLENGGAGGNTLTSFDVLLSNRYATKRNREKGFIPALMLYIDEVTENSVSLSWNVKIDRFNDFKVYISKSPIVDLYSLSDPISKEATLYAEIKDPHKLKCRIEDLDSNTDYYVAVSATNSSGLTGYSQQSFTTLPNESYDTEEGSTENDSDTGTNNDSVGDSSNG